MKLKKFFYAPVLLGGVFAIGLVLGVACNKDDDKNIPGENPDAGGDAGTEEPTVNCESHSVCNALGKVCDIGAGICIDCITNEHCPGLTVCEGTRCEPAKLCSAQAAACEKGLCDLNKGYCVACATNEDCGEAQMCKHGSCIAAKSCATDEECEDGVCDKANSICQNCLTDADCGKDKKCVANYCEPVIACENNDACKEQNMVCSPGAKVCFPCLADGDCPADHHCYNNFCKADVCNQGESRCIGNDIAKCNVNGSSEVRGKCPNSEPCKDGKCPGVGDDDDDNDDGPSKCQPVCGARQCGQYGCCGEDGCGGTCGTCPEGTVCEKGYCLTIPENCQSDDECQDPNKPKCSNKDGRCYPASHCMIVGCGQMFCNPATGFCMAGQVPEWGTCVQEGDCKKGLECYTRQRQCRQPCINDKDCGDGRFCDLEIYYCDDKPCESDADCKDPKKPMCNTSSGRCEPEPVKCKSDEDCINELAPMCNNETGMCVQCFTDADCTEEREVCNARGVCGPDMGTDAGPGDDDDGGSPQDSGTPGPPCEKDDGTCEPPCGTGQICCEYVCYTEGGGGGGSDGGVVLDGGFNP